MNRGVRSLAARLLREPARIDVGKENTVAAGVDHRVMRVAHADKKPLLLHLLARPDVARALIFTRTKAMADRLAQDIAAAGHAVDVIHGDREQSDRRKVLDKFRSGHLRILVATDVAARGIDVPDITHVINYDMPTEAEAYVHRVGRTGRAGATGTALSICATGEGNLLRLVEQAIGQAVPLDSDHPFHDAHHHDRAAPRQKLRGFAAKKAERPPRPPHRTDGAAPHRKGRAAPDRRKGGHPKKADRDERRDGASVAAKPPAIKPDVPQKTRADVQRSRGATPPATPGRSEAKPRWSSQKKKAQAQARAAGHSDGRAPGRPQGGFKPLSRKPKNA
jgi:ATP-dependent RNA helicase RhlE